MAPAGLPADLPAEGLVYGDLIPAAEDALCAGAYEIDDLTCTHGPDPAPPGLRVARDVERTVRDNGAVPATIGMIGGRLIVGLSEPEIDHPFGDDHLLKLDRRHGSNVRP